MSMKLSVDKLIQADKLIKEAKVLLLNDSNIESYSDLGEVSMCLESIMIDLDIAIAILKGTK